MVCNRVCFSHTNITNVLSRCAQAWNYKKAEIQTRSSFFITSFHILRPFCTIFQLCALTLSSKFESKAFSKRPSSRELLFYTLEPINTSFSIKSCQPSYSTFPSSPRYVVTDQAFLKSRIVSFIIFCQCRTTWVPTCFVVFGRQPPVGAA
jgi:hypothetical protein